jgi:hypothetical protein
MLDSRRWSNDQFTNVLVAIDELLGRCAAQSHPLANLSLDFAPPAERPRLEGCLACLSTLAATWPGPRRGEVELADVPGGPHSFGLRAS